MHINCTCTRVHRPDACGLPLRLLLLLLLRAQGHARPQLRQLQHWLVAWLLLLLAISLLLRLLPGVRVQQVL